MRTIRTLRGLSLRTAAAGAGIDVAHLSRVERGEAQLSVDALYRLAVVLQATELADVLSPYISNRERARQSIPANRHPDE